MKPKRKVPPPKKASVPVQEVEEDEELGGIVSERDEAALAEMRSRLDAKRTSKSTWPRIKTFRAGEVLYVCGHCLADAWRSSKGWTCSMCGGLEREIGVGEVIDLLRGEGVEVRRKPVPSRVVVGKKRRAKTVGMGVASSSQRTATPKKVGKVGVEKGGKKSKRVSKVVDSETGIWW
jgi:hypothetical protein